MYAVKNFKIMLYFFMNLFIINYSFTMLVTVLVLSAYDAECPPFDSDGVMSLIVWMVVLGLFLAYYISLSYNLYKLAVKMGYHRPWFAFIPFFNLIMIYELGDIPPWLIVILVVPSLGAFIISILEIAAFYKIAKKNGKNTWLALLYLIPFIQIFVPIWIVPDKESLINSKNNKGESTVDTIFGD